MLPQGERVGVAQLVGGDAVQLHALVELVRLAAHLRARTGSCPSACFPRASASGSPSSLEVMLSSCTRSWNLYVSQHTCAPEQAPAPHNCSSGLVRVRVAQLIGGDAVQLHALVKLMRLAAHLLPPCSASCFSLCSFGL